MKEQWLKLKEWWSNLVLREKLAVGIGASVFFIFILYQGIWSPFLSHIDSIRKRIGTEQKLLVWMQGADKQIQMLGNHTQQKSKSITPVELLSFVQKQIDHVGISGQLTQLKQTSNETIEMQFQKVEFDKVMALVTDISKKQSVSITQMSTTVESTPGVVSVEVVLKAG